MRNFIALTAFASMLVAAAPHAQAGSAPVTAGTVAPIEARTDPLVENVNLYVPRITCVANGTPSEFPNDIVFTNRGARLNAGTKLVWRFSGPYIRGTFTLPAALANNASIRASNIVPGGVQAGKYCTAAVG